MVSGWTLLHRYQSILIKVMLLHKQPGITVPTRKYIGSFCGAVPDVLF